MVTLELLSNNLTGKRHKTMCITWSRYSKVHNLPYSRHILAYSASPGYFNLSLKAWPNGGASRRELKTCVYLRLRLATTCVGLRWLAFTLVEIKFARKSTHRLATQRKSCCVLQVLNYSARSSIISTTFVHLRVDLRVRLASQHKSVHKFNLRLLALPFGQCLTPSSRMKHFSLPLHAL